MALKKHGKEDAEWRRVRAVWVTNNPPNHEGFYVCGICAKSVHYTDMELDHIDPRSHAPASKYDMTNLQPTHGWPCNRMKGSRRLKPLISNAEYELRRLLDL